MLMAWIGQFGYKEDDIVMLTDDQNDPRAIPTKENIVSCSLGFMGLLMFAIAILSCTSPLHSLTELFTFVDIVSRDAVARERRAAERFVVLPLYVLFFFTLPTSHSPPIPLRSLSPPLMDTLHRVDWTCTNGLVWIFFCWCGRGGWLLFCCDNARIDSGHGGQTKDLDGDEADGYDEGAFFAAVSAFLLLSLPRGFADAVVLNGYMVVVFV